MTAEQALPIPATGPRRCQGTCGRILVARTLWAKYSPETRKNLGRTHARYQGEHLCCTCYRRTHPPQTTPNDTLAWPDNAWVLRRGIWYPTGPRPIDAESPNPAYRRTDPELDDLFHGLLRGTDAD